MAAEGTFHDEGLGQFILPYDVVRQAASLDEQDGLKAACAQVSVEIVRRCDVSRFVVLPRRWIVERTIGWLNRCRRLAKDRECLSRNALASCAGPRFA
jgi:transposase